MATLNSKITYIRPLPFVVPSVHLQAQGGFTGALSNLNQFLPVTQFPRETLHYSAHVIENIMYKITTEYEKRGVAAPKFKKYKAGNDNYTEFSPSAVDGSNVQNIPLKFFPNIVNDIQNAILSLIAQSRYPDDIGSLMARIFGQNTIIHNGSTGYWTNSTRIKDGYIVPATDSDGISPWRVPDSYLPGDCKSGTGSRTCGADLACLEHSY